jgi:hypothetical protein
MCNVSSGCLEVGKCVVNGATITSILKKDFCGFVSYSKINLKDVVGILVLTSLRQIECRYSSTFFFCLL